MILVIFLINIYLFFNCDIIKTHINILNYVLYLFVNLSEVNQICTIHITHKNDLNGVQYMIINLSELNQIDKAHITNKILLKIFKTHLIDSIYVFNKLYNIYDYNI